MPQRGRKKGRATAGKSRGKSRAKVSRRSRGRSRGRARARRGRRARAVSAPRRSGSSRRPGNFDFSAAQGAEPEMTDKEMAAELINDSDLRSHIRYLADDLLEGRAPGSRGGMLAAKYIAAQFEALGLEPAGADRSYFQNVPMLGVRADAANKLSIKSGDKTAELKFGDDFVGSTEFESAETPVNADIVFVGYGVNAPENNWDDYKGLDVRGRIVMMMVNDPPATAAEPGLFGGKALTYYGRWTYKYEEAARRGAAGVILIHTNESAGYGWTVVKNSWGGEGFGLVPDGSVNSLSLKSWVTEDAAKRIAQLAGQDLDALRQSAGTREFKPVPLNVRAEGALKYTTRRVSSPNVVGILRGGDEALKNEYVVYSAHWDHFGIRADQTGDNIYNGAVDNATGVAGILSIAKACAGLDEPARRSMLFIATTAEEQGLLGAEYYARHPLASPGKTAANINLDSLNVLGLTTDIAPLGADRSSLGKIIEEIAKDNEVTISPDDRPEQGRFYRSDHFPFAKAGVPAVSFKAGAKFVGHSEEWARQQLDDYNTNRYHQPSDEYSPTWDFNGMVQQTRLAFLIGLRVANEDTMPQWNRGDEFEAARLKSLRTPAAEQKTSQQQ
ncbi:MAG: M28 family peptidase [Blastocatellia bacterium]